MDPAFTTALYATILFCASGGVKDGKCPDGSLAQNHSMSFLVKPPNGKEILFEYDENSIPKFVLYPDGSIKRAGDFNVDDVALAFWQAVASFYKDTCPSIAQVLKPLEERTK